MANYDIPVEMKILNPILLFILKLLITFTSSPFSNDMEKTCRTARSSKYIPIFSNTNNQYRE